ncbi:hypothetical protein [Granulicatella adiacens]|jgi:hypothetical protein|uniref:hypothetical protein n=1 Tax=Granulicatella adiacens TaxID=46124 RepID=UPI00206687FB|nr:MAG TPA: Zinc-binding domain of primase-helicase [Caudoviricetes sp.]
MKYAYISCLGNVYTSDDSKCDNEPCEMCGEYDRFLGEVETMEDLVMLMFQDGFSEQYILERTGYEVKLEKKFDEDL